MTDWDKRRRDILLNDWDQRVFPIRDFGGLQEAILEFHQILEETNFEEPVADAS